MLTLLLALIGMQSSSADALRTAPPPPPAAVAVVFDQEVARPVVVEGLADKSTGRAVSPDDPVRVASISKLVMALATLRLVEEGKVSLNEDVSTYLGWDLRHPDHPEVPVTLLQILMHRSGLRDDAGYIVPLGESLEAKLKDPAAWHRGAPPGEAPFAYANLGSPVVATVLEAASGERYDRLVERTVFAPLGITACLNWIGCPQDFADRAVVLYRSTGDVARDDTADRPPACTIPVAQGTACDISAYVPGTNASIFSPQGGVRISMMDLAKLGRSLLDYRRSGAFAEKLLPDLVITMLEGPKEAEFFCGYGAGMHMIELPERPCNDTLFGDGVPRIGHAGEAYGLRSGLWLDIKTGTGLAYFVTQVPDRTAPDEGGFAPEEVALVRRVQEIVGKAVE